MGFLRASGGSRAFGYGPLNGAKAISPQNTKLKLKVNFPKPPFENSPRKGEVIKAPREEPRSETND